jgi:hypothetical protein
MRPRLRPLAGLALGLRAAARRRRDRRFTPIAAPQPEEQRAADELKRRLDETRERLRHEIPPPID